MVLISMSADGAGNSIHCPSLGAAGTAYARIVPSMTFQPPNQPDPAIIFDSLMARGESFTQHPQGISSVLFYLAIIINHTRYLPEIARGSQREYYVLVSGPVAVLWAEGGEAARHEGLYARTGEAGLL